MKPEDLDLEVLANAEFAVLSGISPALSGNMRAVSRCFVEEAKVRGARVCFDINYRARLWPVSTARPVLADFLGLADIVVASESDARLVFNLEGTDHDVIMRLQAAWAPHAQLIVLTQSERGSVSLGTGGVFGRHPAIRTDVVDRFGAGDAFVAGLLWGLLNGDMETALLKATAAAALKCTMIGDQAQFTQTEVATLANAEFSDGVVR
jgi:2-dehydro-3-deoxygluconokinase